MAMTLSDYDSDSDPSPVASTASTHGRSSISSFELRNMIAGQAGHICV